MKKNMDTRTFYGTIIKMSLTSSIESICNAETDKEIEQHLTIQRDGQSYFRSYRYGEEGEYDRFERMYPINESCAETILENIALYFSHEFTDSLTTSMGEWTLELTNSEGDVYTYQSCICDDYPYELVDLSCMLRELTGLDFLFAFDGNPLTIEIERITVDYNRAIKSKNEDTIDHYSEKLILERSSQTFEYIQTGPYGKKIHKYELPGEINQLLDFFHPYQLFTKINTTPDDVIENPLDTKEYTITVNLNDGTQRSICGSFDKDELPQDYEYFILNVIDFFEQSERREIFSSYLYKQRKPRKSDYLYCSVQFEDSYKHYYYISDDKSVQVGDFVIVPAGPENIPTIVRIVRLYYCDEKHAPYPPEKTKHIIRKCTEEELYEWA